MPQQSFSSSILFPPLAVVIAVQISLLPSREKVPKVCWNLIYTKHKVIGESIKLSLSIQTENPEKQWTLALGDGQRLSLTGISTRLDTTLNHRYDAAGQYHIQVIQEEISGICKLPQTFCPTIETMPIQVAEKVKIVLEDDTTIHPESIWLEDTHTIGGYGGSKKWNWRLPNRIKEQLPTDTDFPYS